jgi:hypothetical protein
MAKDQFVLEKTTHAIIEGSGKLSKVNHHICNKPSVTAICEVKRVPKFRGSEGNINSVRRLASTSCSTSSQSLTNCQYVSVVDTNVQSSTTGKNIITCHANGSNQTAHDNGSLHSNISKVSDKVENSIELTHNYSNDIDIPSKPETLSGNHVDIPKVIIKHDKNSDREINADVNVVLQKEETPVNVESSDDAVAFTDESCTQFIDSEDSINSELET